MEPNIKLRKTFLIKDVPTNTYLYAGSMTFEEFGLATNFFSEDAAETFLTQNIEKVFKEKNWVAIETVYYPI